MNDVVTTAASLQALVDALAPLMDRDYCSPFTSAWELDPHGGPENRDGEVIYVQVRVAWQQARMALAAVTSAAMSGRDPLACPDCGQTIEGHSAALCRLSPTPGAP